MPGVLGRPADLDGSWNWNGYALPTGDPATSVITIEKFSPVEVNTGSSYDYTVRVRNISSNMLLSDVVVTDHLPESGYTFESSSPNGNVLGKTLTVQVGSLNPNEHRDIVIRGKATATGTLKNCASVEYTPLVCVMTDVVSAALEVQKRTPLEVVLCEEIPITVTVRNPGTGVANNVQVVDTLPAGWTVEGRETVTWNVGSLGGGESRELMATAKASRTGTFTNTVKATADGGLTAESSTQTAVRQPVLAITKTSSIQKQILGRNTTFTIAVENKGDYPANDFVLVDRLTGAENVVSICDGGALAGSAVTWNLGSLAPGAQRSVTVTVNRNTEGTISNTATASAFCADDVSASSDVVYVGVPAVLLEVVDDPDPIVLNGTTTYTITVTNQGTAKDTNLVIECMLEDGVEFVSATGATAHTVSGKSIQFAALAELLPKRAGNYVATWTVVVRGTKVADTRFKVSLNTDETSRPIEETESTRFYE
jgi:uncharacterized repeat protein (TIGR01451 family)